MHEHRGAEDIFISAIGDGGEFGKFSVGEVKFGVAKSRFLQHAVRPIEAMGDEA